MPPRDEKAAAEAIARGLVQKYSHFVESREGSLPTSSKHRVLLTGATGSLGCHILFALLERESVDKVYCLVRAQNDESALQRVKDALRNARLVDRLQARQVDKIVAFSSDLGDEHLGLCQRAYEDVVRSTTAIIHNAWSVNFNRPLASFEAQSIRGLWNMLNTALLSPLRTKPALSFVSSIGSVMLCQERPVLERHYGWEASSPMGYAQSKWVAEQICRAASQAGLDTRVLRVGQVVGDSRHGMWNAKEAVPHLVQCALTVGALPVVEQGDDWMNWLPADTAGAVVAELALLQPDHGDAHVPSRQEDRCAVFHVNHAQSVGWNGTVLPALRQEGLQFDAVPQREWLARLEASEPDTALNPPRKLLDFFRTRYGSVAARPARLFDSTRARRFSPSLRGARAVDDKLIAKFVNFWVHEAWGNMAGARTGPARL